MSRKVVKLESLAAKTKYSLIGGPFGSKLTTSDYVDNGIPVIRGSNLNSGRYLDETEFVFVSEQKMRKDLSANLAHRGDVVFTQRGTLGKTALIPNDSRFESYIVSQSQMKLTVDSKKADPYYIYYYFSSHEAVQKILNQSSSSGVPHINLTSLRNFLIPYVPLPDQRSIAEILSVYDDLIENNRRRIALLERAARLLYREWFVHFRYPGHKHVKIIDGIPEGWHRRYLRDVVTTQYGHTASASDVEIGPKFVRGMDINKRSFIDWSTVPYCRNQSLDFNKYALIPGDILVIRMADPGKVGLVEKSIHAVFASYLVRFKIRNPNELPPIYLFMTLMEDRYQGFIRSSSGGSTRKSASARLLTDFHFVQPPKFLLELFIGQVAPIREMITKLVDLSTRAAQARDLLLPRLMNAEIAV